MTDTIPLIHKEAESDFGVSFPDFPGCVTASRSLEEARARTAEALALHVEGMIEDGEPPPARLGSQRSGRITLAFAYPSRYYRPA